MLKKLKFLLATAAMLCVTHVCANNLVLIDHALAGKIWDSQAGIFIDEATFISRLNASKVLLLGEIHDNPEHHNNQLKIFNARIASGDKPVLLMEQLDVESQPALNAALTNKNRDAALTQAFELIKFSDRQFYEPLIAAAYENQLPVIAANVSRAQLQPVIWHGFDTVDAKELKRLAVEEVWNESRQKYLYGHMGGAHCGQLREEIRLGLARSQRLRDAIMVDNALASVEHGIVAIVGRDHARRDIGLPLYFNKRAPNAKVISVGFMEVAPGYNNASDYQKDSATGENVFDYIWFSPQVKREDPCEQLKH